MFTGLVEGMATVRRLVPEGPGLRIVVEPPEALRSEPVALGDSIALNGCCLTVVAFNTGAWEFQAGPETLAKTNLGRLQVGDTVNVERPLAANGRLGGHFVQGHVDGTGQVDTILSDGEWVTLWFRVPERLALEMVPKGSVTVDGVSLTLVEVERDRFSVALIPHTLQVTTLGRRQPGDAVNIETDILAKYTRKFLTM
jgi:riboflavin synthase